MDARFDLFGGSARGGEHARLHRNNQDGLALFASDELVVAAVTDGCSSGRGSEVGARYAAEWIVRRVCADRDPSRREPATLTRDLTECVRGLAHGLRTNDEDPRGALHDFFLFTFLVAIIEPELTTVFGVGDGVVSVNGRVTVLDAGPENAPDYVAYGVLGKHAREAVIHHAGPTADVHSLIIGTDGVADLIARADDILPDGSVVGGLAALENDERYVKNPSLLQKRLIALGEVHRRLRDDTSIAVIRRRGERRPSCAT
ncbi:MAG: protein phosphatase 2C domain-containing protein [Polyangiaceae bacterium]